MVDESCVVAADRRIDDRVPVDDEQEGVIVVDVVILVTIVRGPVRNALAEILDDARALPDRRQSEYARPCNGELRTSMSVEFTIGGPPRVGCDWSKATFFFFFGFIRRRVP